MARLPYIHHKMFRNNYPLNRAFTIYSKFVVGKCSKSFENKKNYICILLAYETNDYTTLTFGEHVKNRLCMYW